MVLMTLRGLIFLGLVSYKVVKSHSLVSGGGGAGADTKAGLVAVDIVLSSTSGGANWANNDVRLV